MTDQLISLNFAHLREANLTRIPEFKNSKGLPAHSKPDGSDWSPAQWLQAVTGELGEYANLRKKVERGDLTMEEARVDLGKELADVVIYLDILAAQLDIDLGDAVTSKWNEVSERIGCNLRVDSDGVYRQRGDRATSIRRPRQRDASGKVE